MVAGPLACNGCGLTCACTCRNDVERREVPARHCAGDARHVSPLNNLITDDELALEADGSVRSWTPSQVRQIRRRMGDSVLNGALIGGAIGGGIGSLSYLDNECREEPGCIAGVLAGAAMCAGIGAVIDAFIRGDRVIYEAPAGSDTSRMRVTLGGGKGRAVLQLKMRF